MIGSGTNRSDGADFTTTLVMGFFVEQFYFRLPESFSRGYLNASATSTQPQFCVKNELRSKRLHVIKVGFTVTKSRAIFGGESHCIFWVVLFASDSTCIRFDLSSFFTQNCGCVDVAEAFR